MAKPVHIIALNEPRMPVGDAISLPNECGHITTVENPISSALENLTSVFQKNKLWTDRFSQYQLFVYDPGMRIGEKTAIATMIKDDVVVGQVEAVDQPELKAVLDEADLQRDGYVRFLVPKSELADQVWPVTFEPSLTNVDSNTLSVSVEYPTLGLKMGLLSALGMQARVQLAERDHVLIPAVLDLLPPILPNAQPEIEVDVAQGRMGSVVRPVSELMVEESGTLQRPQVLKGVRSDLITRSPASALVREIVDATPGVYAEEASLSLSAVQNERGNEIPKNTPEQQAGVDWLLGLIGLRRRPRSLSRAGAAVRQLPQPTSFQSLPDVVVNGVAYPAGFVQFIRGFGEQLHPDSNSPFGEMVSAPKSVEEMNPSRLNMVYKLWQNRVLRIERQVDPNNRTGLFTVVTVYHSAPHSLGVVVNAGNSVSGRLLDIADGKVMKIELEDPNSRGALSRRVEIETLGSMTGIYAHLSEFNRLSPILNGTGHPDDFYNGSPLWYFAARELAPAEAEKLRTEIKRLGASFNMSGLEALMSKLFTPEMQVVNDLKLPQHNSFRGLAL